MAQRWARRLLGSFVFLLGCGKVVTQFEPTSALPEWIYHAFAGIELVLGAVLMVQGAVWSARALVVFFATAALLTLLHDGDCG